MNIPLRVLPPRRPPWNGCVERANRSARAEFWSRHTGTLTVAGIALALADYEFFFNYKRPHAALEYRTPNEYLVELEEAPTRPVPNVVNRYRCFPAADKLANIL